MKRLLSLVAVFLVAAAGRSAAQTVWLDELDLNSMESGWGTAHARRSVEGNPLRVAGKTYERGVGTHAVSTYLLNLDGKANRFTASVGVDDEADSTKASIEFFLVADGKELWKSGVMRKGSPAKPISVDLRGVKLLGLLVTGAGDGIDYDHADWCDALIDFSQVRPRGDLVVTTAVKPYVLTPKAGDAPRINGAKVAGVRPGNPFLYRIAATGKRPMTFEAKGLPEGLALDATKGIITGKLTVPGTYRAVLIARNDVATVQRELRIVVGNTIAFTPPMGWNSWNCWACAVDDPKVRASADALVSSGLADHGWCYINIDDCWMVQPGSTDSVLGGAARDANGMINTNGKFPDIKGLADYVHGKGLKLGIYSSPGPETCAGYTASWQHEREDAQRFGEWGIDYLKYDWCSYDRIAKDHSLPELKQPYEVMRAALDAVRRDIVFSLCQYGMGNVWEWGADVGGNCWRTTGDITDTWSSMSGIGFGQAGHEQYARPGHWNDPDMLVVGLVGWGPELHPSHLTPDEQYTHISLWSLLAAPLLIGCDLTRMDDFALNLLTNDEVIAVNQDPLGNQARQVSTVAGKQIWAKETEDGSIAVGLFFADDRKRTNPADYFSWTPRTSAHIVLRASDIGIKGKFTVRDLWRQKDLGTFQGTFEADVPYHGVILVRVKEIQ